MFKQREIAILVLAILLVAAAGFALSMKEISVLRFTSYFYNFQLYLASWVIFSACHVIYELARHRPDSPIHYVRTMFGPAYWAKVKRGLPIIIGVVVFMSAFSTMKSAIPLFNDFTWDNTFIEMDRAIHGTDPWRLLQPVFGSPLVTAAFAALYHVWILLIYCGSVYFAIYVADRQLVYRYFLSYLAIWSIGGVVFATLFASVGPCFAGPLLGIDTFDEKMALLNEANEQFPIMVLEVQQILLNWHTSGDHGLGRGITAMPSMHVALAFLFFLAIRKINRTAGIAFFIFFLVVLIGSVHTAYHYAVDGYFSIILALVAWKVAGFISSPKGSEEEMVGVPA